VGSIGGGLVAQHLGYTWLFGGVLALHFVLAATIIAHPETLSLSARRPFAMKHGNPFAVMAVLVQDLRTSALALVFTLSVLVAIGAASVFELFIRHEYTSSISTFGYLLAAIQLSRAFGLLAILPAILRKLHATPRAQLMCGAVATTLAAAQCAMWGVIPGIIAVFIVASTGFAVSWPVIVSRGLLSQAVGPTRQGTLMGAVAVLEACLIPFAGAAVFSHTYSATVSSLPAAFLYVGAGIHLVAGAILLALGCHEGPSDQALGPFPGWTSERKPLLSTVNE
jgi:hypothetical protein